MKISSIIGAVALFLICVVFAIGGIFWFWPEAAARASGAGPFDGSGIALYCALLVIALGGIAWLLERVFERAGRAGLNSEWRKNLRPDLKITTADNHSDKQQPYFAAESIAEHLKQRYGRCWQRKVKILLMQGSRTDIENAAPGLVGDRWQESDGRVLIYGGEALSPADQVLLSELKRLRPRVPVDGIVLVINRGSVPCESGCDAFTRHHQQVGRLLGWRAPVWIWLIQPMCWPQNMAYANPAAVIFGAGADSEVTTSAVGDLIARLRQAGIAQLLTDSRNNWQLNLAADLQGDLGQQLQAMLRALAQGPAAHRLCGVIFNPPRAAKGTRPHILAPQPAWQWLGDSGSPIRPDKISPDWRIVAKLMLLAALCVWCAGTLLSLMINRAQIYQAQERAHIAAGNQYPLPQRLQNQLEFQQTIARLQHRQATGAPWYTRFGLNQDSETLDSLWPLYARNHNQLMRDAAAGELKSQLQAFIRLPPGSSGRTQGTERAYNLLKSYLMLSRPDKADADWLARRIVAFWPQRPGVQQGSWQSLAPKLMGFWAQNLPDHPQWKSEPDAELTAAVRQILLKQIGQRNAESGLYQQMLKRIASNWPDLTLADITGDTDASPLFHTDETVPGMFSRQAWEEQVQQAIEEVVSARRDEIDWVLTDKTRQPDSDVAPETLKQRLTERYFSDFGNAWLNMVNSIQWQNASSLSGAITQLNLLADVRQSPLVALMNTLAWQGNTGQQPQALADTLVDRAQQLIGRKKMPKQYIVQAQGPKGPLDAVFGPLMGLLEGKDGTSSNGNLSFQSWLARVTQVRLKLQQVTNAADPQAMAQILAQTVFQGKSIDLSDTRDYSSLVAASLGQEWSGFGQALFIQPLDLAWRQILTPAAASLNNRWQSGIVQQWNSAFDGRYPFKATGSDASLPVLAQFLRADSGRISVFLKNNLGGILRQEGNRWVMDPSASQGIRVDPAFMTAINQLAAIVDIVFAQGDAGLNFELMARTSKDIARMQLAVDGQHLDYFNQMESWQRFRWPGDSWYPGANLNWRTVTSGGMQLYDSTQGNWGWIRLLEKARVTQLDSSRAQLIWLTPEGRTLKFILRSELGDGPLALLRLRGFRLPENIFDINFTVQDDL